MMATVNLMEQEERPKRREKLPFKIKNHECVLEVDGTTYIFGYDDDVDAAVDRYYRTIGRLRRRAPNGDIRMAELVQHFDEALETKVELGEITQSTRERMHKAIRVISDRLRPNTRLSALTRHDFVRFRAYVFKKYSPGGAKLLITNCRRLMLFAEEMGFITSVDMGQGFRGPTKSMFRRQKAERGRMDFTQAQVKIMLAKAKAPARAMVLLGLNCGFGNTDVANMKKEHITEWINYPRVKTHIDRRLWLWPETLEALEAAAKKRSFEARYMTKLQEYVFITPSCKVYDSGGINSAVRPLLRAAGATKELLGFYGFRRTFATVATNCGDQIAVDSVMGHVDKSMAAVYRQVITDERIRACQSFVRDWVFG